MKRKFKSQLDPVVPAALGMSLTEQQIDEIAQTLYSRFYQKFGSPDWKSTFNVDNRKLLNKVVKQVVDSMVICDYAIGKEAS